MRSFSLNTNMYEMRMASVAMSAIRLRLCGENGANMHTNCPNDEPSSTPSVTMPQPDAEHHDARQPVRERDVGEQYPVST